MNAHDDAGSAPKVLEDGSGLIFEYLDENEAELLYDEIFVQRCYSNHGIEVCRGGVFSLHTCLTAALIHARRSLLRPTRPTTLLASPNSREDDCNEHIPHVFRVFSPNYRIIRIQDPSKLSSY